MLNLWNSVSKLAEAYEHLLFDGELRSRFVHHLAHVASEQWLSVELALLVNERAKDFGLAGWAAVAEKQRVDVTLLPPGTNARDKLPENSINLELKLIGADWWRTIWPEVRADLNGKSPKKPRAHFAVCFLTNAVSDGMSARRPATTSLYGDYLSSVPIEPGEFEPIAGEGKFYLLRSSPERELLWPRPIYQRWPDGYKATIRMLWITVPARLRDPEKRWREGDDG
jgi:hypothetical protein